MKQEKNIINCPECGETIDVNDILYHQVDEQLKKQYAQNELTLASKDITMSWLNKKRSSIHKRLS